MLSAVIRVVLPVVARYWKIALFTAVSGAVLYHWYQYSSLKTEVATLSGEKNLLQVLNRISADNVSYVSRLNRICHENKELISEQTKVAIERLELENKQFGEAYAEAIEHIGRLQVSDDVWLDADITRVLRELRAKAGGNKD